MASTRLAVALSLAAIVVTSGCLGFVSGGEALSYEATAVDVSADAKQATGYNETKRETITINQTVADRDVRVINKLARYEKYDDVAEERRGVLAVVSTHRVDVFGHTTNPIANMTYRELLTNLTADYADEFESMEDLQFQENTTRTVLGTEARIGVFTSTTKLDGEVVEVKLYVTRVQHGDDYVIAIGGHPTKFPASEQEILRLMEGIQHQTDGETADRLGAGDGADGAAAAFASIDAAQHATPAAATGGEVAVARSTD